jgi:hypothetical protein
MNPKFQHTHTTGISAAFSGGPAVRAPNPLPHPSSLPNTAEAKPETEPESDSESETKSETESFSTLVAKSTGKALAKLLFARYFCKSVGVDGAMVGAIETYNAPFKQGDVKKDARRR